MMKITIEYSNKIYNFEHGYETYIFCAAVNNEFDKTHPDELKDFRSSVTLGRTTSL